MGGTSQCANQVISARPRFAFPDRLRGQFGGGSSLSDGLECGFLRGRLREQTDAPGSLMRGRPFGTGLGCSRDRKVLINGASGGVGTFAVQIAKALGAEVTGVCSTANVDLVRSLGADAVVDYTREDFTQGGRRYDVILDFPHFADHSLRDCRRALTSEGTLVAASNTRNRWIGGFSRVLPARLMAPFVSQRMLAPEMAPSRADLVALAELVDSGQLTPVIDRSYPLVDVAEAMRYFERGHAHGKVVITV